MTKHIKILSQKYPTWIIIPVVLTAGIFFSCSNSNSEIEEVSGIHTRTPEEMDTIHMTMYSEGNAIAILSAPRIQRKTYPSRTYFPDGLTVIHYDSLNQVEAKMVADSGIYQETSQKFEVFDNVVIENFHENQTLYTDYLIWEKLRGKLQADSSSVRTDDPVLMYDGLDFHKCQFGVDTDEKFSWYVFRGYSNIVQINTDSLFNK